MCIQLARTCNFSSNLRLRQVRKGHSWVYRGIERVGGGFVEIPRNSKTTLTPFQNILKVCFHNFSPLRLQPLKLGTCLNFAKIKKAAKFQAIWSSRSRDTKTHFLKKNKTEYWCEPNGVLHRTRFGGTFFSNEAIIFYFIVCCLFFCLW